MDSEWTAEELTSDLQGGGQDPWKTPRRYRRKKGRDGDTPKSVQRASKTHRMTTEVEEERADLMRSMVNQEVNRLRGDIERDMKKEMHKELERHKIEMHAEINRLRHKIETALKDEMRRELEKQKVDMYAFLKLELQTEIRNLIGNSNLHIKEELERDLKATIEIDIEKNHEAVKKSISLVQDNVEKNMQTWAEVAKDAKNQAEHAQNEIKSNAPWIEIVKNHKGAIMDRVEVMNATLEEEAKRKARALHVRVTGWTEKGSPQQDAEDLRIRIGASNVPISSAWRVGRDETKPKALIIRFTDMEKKTAFLSKRTALKGEKIYLSEDLTPAQVAHPKENMPRVLAARQQGKWCWSRPSS